MTPNDVRLPSLHFSWKEAPSSTPRAGGLGNTAFRRAELHWAPRTSPESLQLDEAKASASPVPGNTRVCSLGLVKL